MTKDVFSLLNTAAVFGSCRDTFVGKWLLPCLLTAVVLLEFEVFSF